jgi:arginyl-tRNA synthetase
MMKKNTIEHHISSVLLQAQSQAFPESDITREQIASALGAPPDLKMGHMAFACFPLAKVARMAPPMIATKLAEHINTDDIISEVITAGPYLNFKIKSTALGTKVIESILSGDTFSDTLTEKPVKMMVEYSQPNTHKVLHVGHMRNLCLGNAVVRLNQYAGHEVLPVTYPGDVGTHVAKCLWYLKYKYDGEMPEENKGAWLGDMYVKANDLLESERDTPAEDENRKQLTSILKELHDGKGEFYDLWQETRQWSLTLMKSAYSWANVEFDRWFFESEVDAPSVSYAKELLDKKFLVEDQGAIGMDLKDDKLGFCILIKSDGTGLYSTKDVELARVKFEEFGIEKNIYVVDNRQSFHFKQVFKVLEKVGFEQAKDCFHLQYDVVELPDGAMSSRKGNIIPLMDLIAQMEQTITTNYLEKYRGQWSDEEIAQTATDIANGAIKYGMIRMDNNRKIVFDLDEWLKLDGETGPYLQYVHARICSLFDKLSGELTSEPDWNLLEQPEEIALMIKLMNFNQVMLQSAEQLKTVSACSYLYELAKLFNSFYTACPIGKADTPELGATRLALSNAVRLSIKKGLELLGIPAPTRM